MAGVHIRNMKPKINADYTWFDLELIASPIHRWGVRALQKIPSGQYIIEYTGRLLNRAEHRKAVVKRRRCYTYQLDSKGYWSLDGAVNGSGAERVNHSCDPNVYAKILGKRVFFVSLRPIKKGEELTVDYRFDWPEDGSKPVKCLCGAKRCRGTINIPNKGKR